MSMWLSTTHCQGKDLTERQTDRQMDRQKTFLISKLEKIQGKIALFFRSIIVSVDVSD